MNSISIEYYKKMIWGNLSTVNQQLNLICGLLF